MPRLSGNDSSLHVIIIVAIRCDTLQYTYHYYYYFITTETAACSANPPLQLFHHSFTRVFFGGFVSQDLAIVQYQAVVKGMTHHGREVNHPSIVELSLKLAECHARKGDRESARAGIVWAVSTAQENAEAASSGDDLDPAARENAVALHGMSLDALAMFLSEGGMHEAAAQAYAKTIPVIESLPAELQGSRLAAAHSKICFELTCAGAAPGVALQHAADAVRLAEESNLPEDELEVYRANLLRLKAPPEAASSSAGSLTESIWRIF